MTVRRDDRVLQASKWSLIEHIPHHDAIQCGHPMARRNIHHRPNRVDRRTPNTPNIHPTYTQHRADARREKREETYELHAPHARATHAHHTDRTRLADEEQKDPTLESTPVPPRPVPLLHEKMLSTQARALA